MAIDFNELKAPLPPEKVSWRVGTIAKNSFDPEKGGKATALAYIDARDVMERLDEVCGPENWACSYSHANGKTVCDIAINAHDTPDPSKWPSKADGAGDSDIEAEKGALSDAFKRAAVRWGIGRYLYDIKSPWVQIDRYKHILDSEYDRLMSLLPNAGNVVKQQSPAGLSKTPAQFWSRPKLTVTLTKEELALNETDPAKVLDMWAERFCRGIEKGPNIDLLEKYRDDNSQFLQKLSEDDRNEILEAIDIRIQQHKEFKK